MLWAIELLALGMVAPLVLYAAHAAISTVHRLDNF
jgi:hypothetical protein